MIDFRARTTTFRRQTTIAKGINGCCLQGLPPGLKFSEVPHIVTGFRLLNSGVVEVDMWHFARLFSAALTFAIFMYVRVSLHKMLRKPEHQPSPGVLESMLLVRSASTLYVMAATLFLLYSTVDWQHLPVFRLNWWPKP